MGSQRDEATPRIQLIAKEKSWIDGDAIKQLEQTASLPGMTAAVGLPDLHAGKGNPIGAAFLTDTVIYPHLVGSDIGCGMGLWRTDRPMRKVRRDRLAKALTGLDDPWEGDAAAWLNRQGCDPALADRALGTIGGGNHFAEFQTVARVVDEARAAALGLAPDMLYLLVHSGSRGLGASILSDHAAAHGTAGLRDGTAEQVAYLDRHDAAVRWGVANRALIADRFLDRAGIEGTRLLDLTHNSVTASPAEGGGWLHRKGAAPSDQGAVVIPGSRGTSSYVVMPVGPQADNGWSVAHGAGRKWSRAECKQRLSRRFRPADLLRTAPGGLVVCEDRALLYEEAPPAYKDIDRVVDDLVEAGIVTVVAVLDPVVTYKTRRG